MKTLTFKDLKWVQNTPDYYGAYLKGVCCFCIDNYKPKLYYNNDNRGINVGFENVIRELDKLRKILVL